MQSRILINSYVIDFIDIEFDSDNIKSVIKLETDKVLQSLKNDALKDWEIRFNFTYNTGNNIFIYKKLKSELADKFKEITIHIPIPRKEVVSWGVRKEQHIYDDNHFDKIIKNFDCLDVDYSKFHNRRDYILNCMRRAIKFCFENGFTINGIKVKI